MTFVTDGQGFGIVALTAANFAHHVNVWKKIHFDAAETVALAGFAAAALYVETEAAGFIATSAGFGKHREEFANRSEDTCVRCGIGARSAANGRLIDFDHFINILYAENFAVSGRSLRSAIELLCKGAVQNVIHESGFSGTRDTGYLRQ